MKEKQANAISYSRALRKLHSLSQQIVSAFSGIKRNKTVQLFLEFLDQRFGCLGATPLTKKPEVSENHTLPLPQFTLDSGNVPNSNKTDCQSLKDADKDAGA